MSLIINESKHYSWQNINSIITELLNGYEEPSRTKFFTYSTSTDY